MSSSYAPPSHPPPPQRQDVAGGQNAHYAPTTVPTPGQALLRNGKMLVYPHGWRGCPKCQDTGYKQGDPSNPCRKCWQSYGQAFNPLLISTSGLQGAKVLQRPLPLRSSSNADTGATMMPGAFPALTTLNHSTGNAGYPGSSAQQFSGPSAFAPPDHAPPPHSVTAPPGRAQVSRTDDAREDDLNEIGEAPPAYEDAVAAGPDGAAPPQRADNQQSHRPQQNNYPTPSNAPPTHHGTYDQQHHHSTQNHPLHSPHHPQQPYFMPIHGPPAMATAFGPQYMQHGQMPPAGALVVRPGDPRIGGRLCYKCGGDGIREDFWFGSQETCRTCGGTGRIM